ncbi:Trm112 family protein [Carnimonas bestiolae]|uniref:Trm112 family protein n=1 Tax=Carnimonas bestiolae TaxID=3402172 RepID=UPI003EDB7DBD
MDKELLAMLVCPQSQAPLEYDNERSELVCRQSGLAYPVRDGIPVMLVNEARQLDTEEKLGKPRNEAPALGGE